MNHRPMSQADLYRGEVGQNVSPSAPRTCWSTGGTLIAGSIDSQVGLQASFPESSTYTVSFYITPPTAPPAVPTLAVRADAIITWSVAGNSIVRRVTLGNGITVSLVAEAVSVVIIDASDPSIFNGGPPPGGSQYPYNVGVTVAKGTRPTTQQPPTLAPNPRLAGNGAGTVVANGAAAGQIPVPQNVGVNSVHVTVARNSGPFNPVPDQSALVGQFGQFLRKTYDPRATDWEPVDSSVTTISVQNHLTALDGGDLIFSVVFGIDG